MPTFAAIDIGSNSVRLKIARLVGHRLREIVEDREVTRLGESVFRSGFLSPEAMENTIKVLRRFHRTVQREGADVVRVVATSALRDARNSRAFLEWVRSATGWKVEIISGLEEARLIHLGLVSSLRVNVSPILMIDLGGGSCELTISSKNHIRDTISLPLGAVRLTNEFLQHDPPRKSELRRLRGFVEREIGRISGRIVRARPKSGKQIESERWDSLRAAVEHYHIDMDHALQVRESAMHLFSVLRSVHRLPIEYAEWLSAAAMLYEVGDYVNRNGRHRHTYYIIANSEILGYTPQQRRIIAAIARYLGKSRPAPGDAVMKNLVPTDRESVRKASLLLRLARALNLGRTGAVRQTRVYARNGAVNVRLEAKPRASVDLELWAVEKEKSYFREVFGRELSAATL